MKERLRQKNNTKFLDKVFENCFFKKMKEKLLNDFLSDMTKKENKIQKIKSHIGQIVFNPFKTEAVII